MPAHAYRYPFLDLGRANAPYAESLKQACAEVIDSGRYISGPAVEEFEADLARYCGTSRAVGCGNGLDAIRLIFMAAIELGRMHPGDEVIVPANTYFASLLGVSQAGLRPVPVEPDPATHNIDSRLIEAAVTPRTRAILTVHLYGCPAFDAIMADTAHRHGLMIVEDAAQAIGAATADGRRAGAMGHAAAFSFYPTKNVGALGDAGAVTTSDTVLADTVLALRNYGSRRLYHFDYKGINSRLDPIQAAMLRVKLAHIDDENEGRRALAVVYDRAITNPLIVTPQPGDGRHVYHQYVVRCADGRRDEFRDFMARNGVETAVHYPLPPHRQPCYQELAACRLPIAERLAGEVVSLPVNPHCTTEADAAAIANIINDFR